MAGDSHLELTQLLVLALAWPGAGRCGQLAGGCTAGTLALLLNSGMDSSSESITGEVATRVSTAQLVPLLCTSEALHYARKTQFSCNQLGSLAALFTKTSHVCLDVTAWKRDLSTFCLDVGICQTD